MPGNKHCVWSLLLLLLLPLTVVAGDTVWFLYDAQNEHQQQYVTGSEALLRAALPELTVMRADVATGELHAKGPAERTLLITVGVTAANQAADSGLPTLNTLITRYNFNSLQRQYSSPVSALYLDQPVKRQLQLVKSALPLRNKLTVLVGRESQALVGELEQQTRRLDMQLRVIHVDEESAIDQLFGHELQGEDTLLLLPDPEVVNRRTVKPLVLGSYRQGVPLIGYSQALVKAGALMAVHSSLPVLQQQALVMVQNYFSDGVLPVPRYASDYEVSVNYQLARALKLTLPSEENLKHVLQERLR
jgi:putative ABC transport system substrate-binding protein